MFCCDCDCRLECFKRDIHCVHLVNNESLWVANARKAVHSTATSIKWLRFCRHMEFTLIDMELMLIDIVRENGDHFDSHFSPAFPPNSPKRVSYLIEITDEWAPIHWNQVDKSICWTKTKMKTTQKKKK